MFSHTYVTFSRLLQFSPSQQSSATETAHHLITFHTCTFSHCPVGFCFFHSLPRCCFTGHCLNRQPHQSRKSVAKTGCILSKKPTVLCSSKQSSVMSMAADLFGFGTFLHMFSLVKPDANLEEICSVLNQTHLVIRWQHLIAIAEHIVFDC